MADEASLHQNRGTIFQDMALVELAMNSLISLEYLGKIDRRFISEFLQEPRFSFELRKKIFRQVYERRYSGQTFPWKSLQAIQEKRNILAHARLDKTIISMEGKVVKEMPPHYQYHTQTVDAENLHSEFKDDFHKVAVACNAIAKDTHVTFSDKAGKLVS